MDKKRIERVEDAVEGVLTMPNPDARSELAKRIENYVAGGKTPDEREARSHACVKRLAERSNKLAGRPRKPGENDETSRKG